MEIGEKIKLLREKAGFKQTQIASYLGIDQTYLSKIESGERNVTVEILESLAILYRLKLEDFDCDDIEPNPITFSMRSKNISNQDLVNIAAINKIAYNSKTMADLLENTDEIRH